MGFMVKNEIKKPIDAEHGDFSTGGWVGNAGGTLNGYRFPEFSMFWAERLVRGRPPQSWGFFGTSEVKVI
jgi:hypothetical protein